MARAMMATLFMQLIAFGLAIPVLIKLSGVSTWTAVLAAGGTALLCLVSGGLMRRPIGYLLGWLTQLAALATGLVDPMMFVVALIFVVVYVLAFGLGKKIDISAPAGPSGS